MQEIRNLDAIVARIVASRPKPLSIPGYKTVVNYMEEQRRLEQGLPCTPWISRGKVCWR